MNNYRGLPLSSSCAHFPLSVSFSLCSILMPPPPPPTLCLYRPLSLCMTPVSHISLYLYHPLLYFNILILLLPNLFSCFLPSSFPIASTILSLDGRDTCPLCPRVATNEKWHLMKCHGVESNSCSMANQDCKFNVHANSKPLSLITFWNFPLYNNYCYCALYSYCNGSHWQCTDHDCPGMYIYM